MGKLVTLHHPKHSGEINEAVLENGLYVELNVKDSELCGYVQAVKDEDGDIVGTLIYVDSITPEDVIEFDKEEE